MSQIKWCKVSNIFIFYLLTVILNHMFKSVEDHCFSFQLSIVPSRQGDTEGRTHPQGYPVTPRPQLHIGTYLSVQTSQN